MPPGHRHGQELEVPRPRLNTPDGGILRAREATARFRPCHTNARCSRLGHSHQWSTSRSSVRMCRVQY